MDYEQIRYETGDGIATITLDRPERMNAWTGPMQVELNNAFDRIDADDDVRVVIITGEGRAFCAGSDLEKGGDTFDWADPEVAKAETGTESGVPRDPGGQFTLRMFESTKPVICALNGAAVGIGATMTLAMDIRVASEKAKFGFVFTRRGITPEAASSFFLPRLVGISQAMEWVATGRVFGADEALAGGLVSKVVSPEELIPYCRQLATEVIENTAPVSVAMARRMMWDMLGASHPLEAHRADSLALFLRGQSADAREGIESFLEKRPAVFPDRVSDGIPDLSVDSDGQP